MGMLKGRKFNEKITATPGPAEGIGPHASTNTKQVHIEDKSLRACCQNAVVVSVLALEEDDHQRVQNIINVNSCEFEAMSTAIIKNTKSTSDTAQWRLKQFRENGFAQHFNSFIGNIADRSKLKEWGFFIPASPHDRGNEDNNEMIRENEFADMYFSFNLSAIRNRAHRSLEMFGCPYVFTRARGGGPKAQAVMDRFKLDCEIFDEFEALVDKTAKEKTVSQSHRFKLTCNIQMREMAIISKFKWAEDLERVTLCRDSAAIGTLFIENVNGVQGNHKASKMGKKFKRPELVMARSLDHKLISSRFKYKPVATTAPLQTADCGPPADAFLPQAANTSMDLSKFVSTQQDPGYWSPACINLNVPDANMYCLRQFKKEKNLRQFDRTWMGRVSHAKHKLAIGISSKSRAPHVYQWYFALDFYHNSDMHVWPCKMVELDDTHVMLEPAQDVYEPVLVPLTTLLPPKVMACSYEVKSWWWQCASIPGCQDKLLPGIRAFRSARGVGSVGVVASWEAWWDIGRVDCIQYCRELSIVVDTGMDFFEVLFTMLKSLLKLSDFDTLTVVLKKLAQLKAPKHSEALMEINEATAVLEKHDIEKVHAAIKSRAEAQNEADVF